MGSPEDDYKDSSLQEKLLTPEEERDLAHKVKSGDDGALERFIKANLRLVVRQAGKLHRRMPWVPESDMIQDGNLALWDAVKGYKPEKGFRFSTYAGGIIRQRMMSGVRERMGIIYIPEEVQKAREKLGKGQYQFISEFGYFPTHFELCEYLGVGLNMAKTLEKLPSTVSMESMRQSRGLSYLIDKIPDQNCSDPWQATLESITLKQLYRAFNRLSKKKRIIILRRYGIVTGEPESQGKIGRSRGVTRACIYLHEKKAMEELREHVGALQEACLL